MVLPFGQEWPVGPDETRNWLRTTLPERIWTGLSGSELLRQLRDIGVSIRTQDFFQVRREVLGLQLHQEAIGQLGADRLVPAALFNESHGLELSQDFQYRFRIAVRDPVTGEITEFMRALSSSEQLTKAEAEAEMADMQAESAETYGYEVESVSLFNALAQPGAFSR